MKKVRLKDTALELSNICLGAAGFGPGMAKAQTFEILDAFMAAGGNFIDTANVYGKWMPDRKNHSEEVLGEWLKSGNARNKAIIATKGGHYDLSAPQISRVNREGVEKDLEESLRTLGLDHIDFYWLHRDDVNTPVEEIIDMMEGFVKEGKIRYYGASNYTLERMKAADTYAKANGFQGFSAVSNQWSLATLTQTGNSDPTLAGMTDEFYRWHKETKTPMIPYTSTARGFFDKMFKLQPKVKDGVLLESGGEEAKGIEAQLSERNIRIYEDLLELKEKYQVSLYTLSLAYFLNQPFEVIPVSSVRNVEQLKGLVSASDITLPGEFTEKYSAAI
ncbi:MAG: aldo/keto reductase [Oscillospiraceae bacterium]|nr:aldo/keto reductase [Oscillospiraceae bacterium]